MLADSDLTPQQRRVYPHWQAGTKPIPTAQLVGIPAARVRAIFAELRHLEATGGRRSLSDAHKRAKEITATLVDGWMCARCHLRGKHICIDGRERT